MVSRGENWTRAGLSVSLDLRPRPRLSKGCKLRLTGIGNNR